MAHGVHCDCGRCKRSRWEGLSEQSSLPRRNGGGRRRSNWTPRGSEPPQVGFVRNDGPGDDHLASFKLGSSNRDRHTLIADGDYSEDNAGFKKEHNHYGPKAESPGDHFSVDKGYYTGPGA